MFHSQVQYTVRTCRNVTRNVTVVKKTSREGCLKEERVACGYKCDEKSCPYKYQYAQLGIASSSGCDISITGSTPAVGDLVYRSVAAVTQLHSLKAGTGA